MKQYEVSSSDEEDLPFACNICRKHFKNPVVTRYSVGDEGVERKYHINAIPLHTHTFVLLHMAIIINIFMIQNDAMMTFQMQFIAIWRRFSGTQL